MSVQFDRSQAEYPVVSWKEACPQIDARKILRVHRYKDPEKVRPVIREAAERSVQDITELIELEGYYRRVPIKTVANGELQLENGTHFYCEAFDRLLGDSTEIVAFVLTLGPRLDDAVGELIDEFEVLDALFLETAGWLSIESATRRFGRFLRQSFAREGYRVTHRMGPGYSYRIEHGEEEDRVLWPLEQQAQLFDLFAEVQLPVSLTQSCLMKPKMSRSGIFGVVASH